MSTANQTTHRAPSRRRFLQFSLRTLLLLPVLVAVGGYWYIQHRNAVNARVALDSAVAAYQEELGSATAICVASLRLCEAEESVPFASSVRARALHFARLLDIEQRTFARIDLGTYVSWEARQAALDELRLIVAWRKKAVDDLDTR